MKVALIGPVYPYRGGIAHYTTMLYRALRERGHDVLMVSFKRQYPRWLYPGRSDKDPSKRPLVVEDAKYWIDSLNPFTWLTTFWRIWRYQPDVIVLQWWTTFWAPVWWTMGMFNRLFLKKRLFYVCHNVLPHEMRWGDRKITQVVLGLGTRFIVHSVEEQNRLLFLLPTAEVTIVPLPVFDILATKEQVSKEQARKRLGLPVDIPVMLFFGIVREYKGLQYVLSAMPEVRARLGRIVLLIAGEFWGDKRPYLELIEQLGIDDSVIIEDRYIPNEEIPQYFSAADVLVAPYQHMTGSAVLKMAQSFGIPIITTAPKDSLEPGGEVVFLTDSSMLANAIVRYFTEKNPVRRPSCSLDSKSSWLKAVEALEQ